MKELLEMPKFVIQKNAMSRAIYSCSANTRKLLAMAMSLLPMTIKSKKDYTVEFTVKDYIKTLSITDGSKTRETVKTAVKETADFKLTLKDELEEYDMYSWFSRCKYSWSFDSIKYTFNPEIVEILNELRGFAKLDLIDMGKLQSIYAIRYYEIAMSYRGLAGKKGNADGEWFFERTIGELRELFELKDKYKRTGNFRIKVIEQPILELNEADIGFKIKLEYIRKGKFLHGVKFNCKIQEYNNITPKAYEEKSELEKEYEKLEKKYPEEFKILVEQNLKEIELNLFSKGYAPEIKLKMAKRGALEKLYKQIENNKK